MAEQYTPTTEEPLPLEVSILRYLSENWSEKLDNIDRIVLASGLSVALAPHDAQVRAEALREAANGLMATDPVETALSGIDFPIGWLRAEANRIADTNQQNRTSE